MKRTGFVRTEWLAAMAMVAILGMVLLPGFTGAQARTDPCQVNLRLLATAVKLYQEEWDGYYPMSDELYRPEQTVDCRREWFFTMYNNSTHYPNVEEGDIQPNGLVTSYFSPDVATRTATCPDWHWPGVFGGLKHPMQSHGWNAALVLGPSGCEKAPWRPLSGPPRLPPLNDRTIADQARWVMIADLEAPY
jgi:type II secretory pathway pseudopilin PulG